jgi:ubiquinol-cytochrome c reductase cytochrome b subunit
MVGPITRLRDFLYDRLGLERFVEFVIRHPVPRGNVERRIAWAYVLGVATMTAFLLQVVTGIALTTTYIPSAAHAYQSLTFINQEVWFGWVIRGMHYFGASAMIVLISLHMARVFLMGSYKYPREMNWVLGVILLLLTLLMAATGQLLRWDQNGIWTVTVGSQLLGRVPFIGQALAGFILAGDQVGGSTLTRFFAFHVLILPGLIFLTAGLHIYLVLHHGVSEPPEPGRPVDASTYREWYRKETERSPYRYWPDAAWREVVAALAVVAIVIALALLFGPKGPGDPPDPTTIAADPRPDWYFRWYYALLAVKPRGLETFTMVYLPALIGIALLLLPFVANQGERSPSRRPWAVGIVGVVLILLAVLTELGMRAPWSMDFETEPIPAEAVGVTEGPVWHGAALFHERGCQYCHSVAGYGGAYGPDLTDVLRRLPPEIFVTRTVQGFGDMPGYRDTITREELSSILQFLEAMGARH